MRLAAASGLLGLAALAASAGADPILPQPQIRGGAKASGAEADNGAPVVRQDTDEVAVPLDDEPVDSLSAERDLAAMPMIAPLACNADIDTEECLNAALNFSDIVEAAALASSASADPAASATPVVVPCGTCAIVDYADGGNVTLPGGLDVVGRLVFPPSAHVVLNTTSVVVQGRLDLAEPADGRSVKITLYGTEDQFYYPHDECQGTYGEACSAHRVGMGPKPIVVAGGKLDIRARGESCPSWTQLASKISPTDLRVDPAFAACLRHGERLLITSSETQWDADTLADVETADAESGTVTVSAPIDRSLPALDGPGEPEFAVEVASLSRKVMFTAQEDDPARAHVGGHLIVYHTEGVEQVITGVKFGNFGQGGTLGRYPIHFHLSGDSSPSVVSKNVIADSNQRCVVIHSTNGVTVDDNVAYNTRGHCYVTEKGNEVNNVFSNNLGARTRLLNFDNGQSDSNRGFNKHLAATFWVRNLRNEFYGNVAAGSNSIGWWFEMGSKTGNQLSTGPVPSFRDNVAHSNRVNGMTTYRQGWFPTDGGVFENIRVYKNGGESGIKFHNTGPLVIRNALLADNAVSVRYGAHNRGVTLVDGKIVGLSKDLMRRKGRSCPITGSGVYASYNNWPTTEWQRSIVLQNVTFERFTCDSRIINPYFDSRLGPGMGNPIKASVKVTHSAGNEWAKPYFHCDGTAKHAFLEDVDGGLGPSSVGADTPGFVIRNGRHMKAFLTPDACEPLPYGPKWNDGSRCNAFCKEVCLRYFRVDAAGADVAKLVLSQGNVSHSYEPEGYPDGGAKFMMVLPSGDFYGQFYDADDSEVVPGTVAVTPYRAPRCPNYAKKSSFTFAGHEPDRVVRIRSDSNGRYLAVKPDGTKSLRLQPHPTNDIEVTLQKVSCPASLNYYHSNSLDEQCFLLVWKHSNDRRFYAQTDKEWKNGLGATNGGTIYLNSYWFFEVKPCIDSAGDDGCVLIRNAHNGRSLYDHPENKVLGASPSGYFDYVSTNAGYRWKLIDIQPGKDSCSGGGIECAASDECCSHYCHGDGTCSL